MRFAKRTSALTVFTAMLICTSVLAEGGQRHLKPDAVAAAEALVAIKHTDGPEKAYVAFNEFDCIPSNRCCNTPLPAT